MKKNILIVSADYYKEISNNLINGAQDYLVKNKKKKINDTPKYKFEIEYDIYKAPGSFEIPYLINFFKNNYDGFIALGCIIRGETYHFELISNEVARKIMDLSININKPIGFGVLTCENIDQAIERSHPDKRNKGAEAAKACIEILRRHKRQK